MVATKSPSKSKVSRPVIYPDREANIRTLSADDMKKILGWEEVPQNGVGIPEIRKRLGVNIRCTNNNRNRPIHWGWTEALVQELLNLRWRFNGASISIGQTGEVMAGQHRGFALIIADWEWEHGTHKDHWQALSKGVRPSMEIVVVSGINEDDETFSTLNREKPATFADTLFRSDIWPKRIGDKSVTPKVKKELAKHLDYAIRYLWLRTGAKIDPFTPTRTHQEALAFYRNHRKILDSVITVWQMDDAPTGPDGVKMRPPLSQYLPLGFAASLLYLMGCSESDGANYRDVNSISDRSEKKLKFGKLDKAEEYLQEFATGEMGAPIRRAILALDNPKNGEGRTTEAVIACICRGWQLYVADDKITQARVTPDYAPVGDKGHTRLVMPSLGGIDTAGMLTADILGTGESVSPESGKVPSNGHKPKKSPSQAEEFRKRKEESKVRELHEAAVEEEGVDDSEESEESGEPSID